ncbi:c-type cytochrome [Pseudomonas aeruginosa]|uniref:c-type cytochrome n=1 Tax=Pseudomonas aeruginosa TaxID=287 RepID=UPI003FD667A2
MKSVLLPTLLALGTVAPTAQAERKAQQVWADTCAYCHLNGIGPALLGRQLPPAMVQALARYGSRQMPAFRNSEISDAELTALADWISQQPAPTKEQPHEAP